MFASILVSNRLRSLARGPALLLLFVTDLRGAEGPAASPPKSQLATPHFHKRVLATNLTEPISLTVAKDGRVHVTEPQGTIKA